jgi:hypothetical protein
LAAFALAMSIGLEICKPFAIEGVFSCLRAWAFGRALAMAAPGLVAVAYSLTAELSLMAATRGDAAAERAKASDTTKNDRAELARLLSERAAMPSFAPATAETVTAAREAVAAAERVPAVECGKRGPQCRSREAEEAAARTALAKAIADKTATDRAAKLDTDAAAVRARLGKAGAVAATDDPGASALSGLLATCGVAVPTMLVAQWLTLVGVIGCSCPGRWRCLASAPQDARVIVAHRYSAQGTSCPSPMLAQSRCPRRSATSRCCFSSDTFRMAQTPVQHSMPKLLRLIEEGKIDPSFASAVGRLRRWGNASGFVSPAPPRRRL